MIHITQPYGSNLCGQACVAMICEITLHNACILVGKKGKTNLKHLLSAIREKFECQDKMSIIKGRQLPAMGLLRIKWKLGGSHWVVIKDKLIYDPILHYPIDQDIYENMIQGKITSYLNLKPL